MTMILQRDFNIYAHGNCVAQIQSASRTSFHNSKSL